MLSTAAVKPITKHSTELFKVTFGMRLVGILHGAENIKHKRLSHMGWPKYRENGFVSFATAVVRRQCQINRKVPKIQFLLV